MNDMILQITVGILLIVGSIYGLYYWANMGNNIINNLPGITIPCHIFEVNGNCSFGQVVIYLFPFFLFIGVLAMGIAMIYGTCRNVII